LGKIAIQFAVNNDDISSTLVGIGSCEELKQNLSWIEEPIDTQLIQEVREILKPIYGQEWKIGKDENN